ncbi:MAG TPA: transposase, partial [Propylenella sp.]
MRRKGTNKTLVFGMVERGGKIVAGPVPDLSIFTLEPIIRENVEAGSTISTDEFPTYRDLDKSGYEHGAVNHSVEEWV